MKTPFLLIAILLATIRFAPAQSVDEILSQTKVKHGILCLAGLPENGADFAIQLAEASEFQIFVQSEDEAEIRELQEKAEATGLLGSRIFAAPGSLKTLHLGDNLADVAIAFDQTSDEQLLRVLRPLAKGISGDRELIKPVPEGIDDWSHPYHGPDNNPNSSDALVKGNFRTQFINVPKFSPMPEQTVIAGGRMYKAMGHIAHKANQNEWLNTLIGVSAYNGTILWRRPLPKSFMIHRNTMIATEDGLLMGDHESCKLIDGDTGEIRYEIKIPAEMTDGQTWKWMAKRDGVLYGLVGNVEKKIETQKSVRRGMGHWPWGMWDGHDYDDPRTSFGYGRTLVAMDFETKEILWNYRDDEFLDARAVCMNSKFIYCFSPGHFLACLEVETGKLVWKNTDEQLLAAIGGNSAAQHYITGYATQTYMKCTDDYLFFAGPQREQMVVASAKDGKLAWTYPRGNMQIVLRDDAVWAAGAQNSEGGAVFDYATGNILKELPARRACTRATGCLDSIFFRASGGTVRVITETNTAQHIAPMRPPCQDGVLISNGQLYWGPWMCGCQLSLYGNISLAAANEMRPDASTMYDSALQLFENSEEVAALGAAESDWTGYPGDEATSPTTSVKIPASVELAWSADVGAGDLPTAPVAAGGLTFVANRNGVVQALNADGGLAWKSYAAGPVYYPPVVSKDRLFVGCADGLVYAFEAKTGRKLWTFRVGPNERLIPVFGKLISAWPLSGGVAVDEESGRVFAAGGLAHYDGTYVVALDAESGELQAANTATGTMSSEVESGISLQGSLRIVDGELQFLGGGVYEVARFDLDTLECRNKAKVQITSEFRTAFYPYYPTYGKYVSLEHECSDGSLLCHDSNYAGYLYSALQLQEPGQPRGQKDAAREILRRRGKAEPPTTRWTDSGSRRFTSFIVSEPSEQLLATGHPDEKEDEPFLVATNIKNGADVWIHRLPAVAVKGGTAIDASGRIFVSLENGQLLCFKAK
ncbi:MAG: outer membrane protein assembly factor BamB [Verrucomicrobiales bacterium]|jgi:outer membrane protein assembly factor BamB